MRRLGIVLAIAAAFGIVGVAQATLVVEAELSAPTSVGGGLYAYTMSLSYSGGDEIGTFVDIKFTGYNQEWISAIVPTPTYGDAESLGATERAQDSHFLFDGTGYPDVMLPEINPYEGDIMGTPVPLEGKFGWTIGDATNPMPIAQLVTTNPSLGIGALMGSLGSAEHGGNTAYAWISSEGLSESTRVAITPEPTTLGLLAIGIVGLIRRRK
jgi:hypothetical protein